MVRPEYIVCLECGFRAKILRRHLRVEHGLSVDEYRARWTLRSDHPVIAPAYSQRHAAVAKEMGLAAGAAQSSRLRQGGGDAGGDQRRNRKTPFWSCYLDLAEHWSTVSTHMDML